MCVKRALLIILDGFGYSEKKEHNAIAMANMPNWQTYLKEYPHALIKTSGEAVGLPAGVMGNSEVGHLNIGGGRIIPQEFTRITQFAAEHGFDSLPGIQKLLKDTSKPLHIMGLVSDGGVHSHQDNLHHLLKNIYKVAPHKPVYVHVITDGRDTPPDSGAGYVELLENEIKKYANTKIATVVGRFYAMDRDKRWERVQTAYNALIAEGAVAQFTSASDCIKDAYKNGETDEFIKPRQVKGAARIESSDQFVFFNFRADRAREISQALAVDGFKEFATPVKLSPANYVTFTQYQKDFPFEALFTPKTYTNLLGEVVAKAGMKQLRIAETEKYAHVTYFFNGGAELPFTNEDRALIPSTKEVPTYDLKPEMSAYEVTRELVKRIESDEYRLIVCNYANGDMVGHTGVESAAIKAVETLDVCLGQVVKAALAKNFEILVSADHGNCEMMVDPKTNAPFTQHTTFDVPIVWIGKSAKGRSIKNGILADIAPTILKLLEVPQPEEMTGKALI